MNRAVENGVPEALRHYGLPLDEINIGQVLESLNPDRAPELSFELWNLSELSTEPLMKNCSKSDVDPRQGRFLMPQGHVSNYIESNLHLNEDPSRGIPVRVYHTNGRHYYPLLFQQRNDDKYVITHRGFPEGTQWRDVCDAIQLQEGDPIKVWTLRHSETGELCFHIAKLVKG